MPSFVGRIAVHRLAAGAVATSSARLVIAKQLGRVSCPLRASFVRAYATPGRPKKTDTASTAQSVGRSRKTAAGAAAPQEGGGQEDHHHQGPRQEGSDICQNAKGEEGQPSAQEEEGVDGRPEG
ncbi:hypothetical protein PG990_005592 [Apiospora arundinis]